MQCVRLVLGVAIPGKAAVEVGELVVPSRCQATSGREVVAVRTHMQGDLEAIRLEAVVAPAICVPGNTYDVERTHCQSGTEQPFGLSRFEALELADGPGAALRVVVAGHHYGGVLAPRQVPEPRQRRAIEVHLDDQVREQALLLIGLRDPRPCSGRASSVGKRSLE